SSARRQTRAADGPASAEQRNKGRTCDRERRRRKRDKQTDAADDPIPGEEQRRDPLLLRERECGVVRDEVPHQHEGARDLDERAEVKTSTRAALAMPSATTERTGVPSRSCTRANHSGTSRAFAIASTTRDPVSRTPSMSTRVATIAAASTTQDRKSTRLNSSHVSISYAV